MEDSGATPARVFLRPIANLVPLGFFAFGSGMFVLAVLSLGWVPETEGSSAGMLLVLFVFPLELLAAVFAALARDTVAATVLGVFAGSWVTLGVNLIVAQPGETVKVDGFFLLFFTAVALVLAVVAVRGKPLIALLLVLSATRAALDGAHQLGAATAVLRVSGAVALALAATALYGGLAFAVEDLRGRALLPVFRRGADPVDDPGVREQL